jgi:uncharacterized OsmC-like protein
MANPLIDPHVGEIFERNAKAVALRPGVGQGTAKTTVRLTPGLSCELEEGPWKLTVGMSEKSGGSNAGPNPGILGRGALGTCIALGYAMWAARLNVPVTSLEVEVQADYDRRGELGVDPDVPPGYTQVRYIIRVDSPASEEEVMRWIETADRCSSYRDVFARAHDVRREVQFVRTGAAAR